MTDRWMSAKLVDEVAEAIWLAEPKMIGSRRHVGWEEESEKTHDHYRPLAVAAIAEVLRTLETWAQSRTTVYDEDTLMTMLRASPLAPK